MIRMHIAVWEALGYKNDFPAIVCELSHFSRVRLCVNPMDSSPPGPSVHGILQARILEWVACPPPGDLHDPGIKPVSLMYPALASRFFTSGATWEAPSRHYGIWNKTLGV